VLQQAVEVSSPAMEAARQELTVTLPSQPVYLNADAVRLAQVFSNLLNNAAKFTPQQGRIWLTAERQNSDVVVFVKDTGIGIAPSMLSEIFDLFMQIDHSLARARGGLGIGLTLVRRLVEMHGGSVNAFSEGTDRGSEFVVRLPGVIEPPVPAPGKPTDSEMVTGRRILVVDDNHDSAESLALLLGMAGNETRSAFDGVQAVEAAATFRPDVILLDIGSPKLNGYEVARRIREQPWGKDVMLVAVTGWGQAEDREKSAEAGFDEHVVKPMDHAALKALVSRTSSKKNG
jgi:CheY-like chemotaxis protein